MGESENEGFAEEQPSLVFLVRSVPIADA